ncbi:hypothetical protein [Terrisporobacter sp.]
MEILKNDVNITKLLKETTNCNKEFMNYMLKILELEGLICQLNDLEELNLELEKYIILLNLNSMKISTS